MSCGSIGWVEGGEWRAAIVRGRQRRAAELYSRTFVHPTLQHDSSIIDRAGWHVRLVFAPDTLLPWSMGVAARCACRHTP